MKLSTALVLCALLFFSLSSSAQNVLIPDPNFKSALVANTQINRNGDDEIQVSEAADFTGIINVPNLGIEDLSGIEAFTSLTRLYCNNNLLTSVNLSQNTALVALRCNNNALTALDVSNNTALTDLRAFVNRIPTIDISALGNLQTLHIFQNQITTIDLSGNSALKELKVDFNLLTALDLNANTNLTYLDAKQNKLQTLKVRNGNNTNITYFNTVRNVDLLCIEVDDPAYSEANWNNTETETQFSSDCDQVNSDIVHIPDAAFKQVLVGHKDININRDSEIQVAEAANFHGSIFAVKRHIADLTGLEAFTSLRELHVYENDITTIDVSNNSELRVLRFNTNPISSIDLSQLPHLTTLLAHETPLTTLDLSANTELTTLWCFDSQLSTLDVSQNSKLVDLQLNHNDLTDLVIGNQPNLLTLLAYQNQLTSIDVSQAPALVTFRIQQNKLTSIDLEVNSSLRELNVGDNMITALDLSGKPGIRVVHCYNNQLTALDISRNPTVFSLKAYKNKLTVLNVESGNNTAIREFDVTRNPSLTCIQVDDAAWSEANWTMVDPQANFSEDCGYESPDVVNIPDPAFRAKLFELGVDTNGDEKIQYAEAEAVTGELNLDAAGILDPTGIEAFINTKRMNWEHNNIQALDVRFNTALEMLDCGYMDLTSLQVNAGLDTLICYTNRLTTLNLNNVTELKYIDFSDNDITGFDLDDYLFTSIIEVVATSGNPLYNLDLKSGANLKYVALFDIRVSTVDLSASPELTKVRINSNPDLEFLNVKNGNNINFDEFSVAGNPKLTCIEVDDVEYAEEHFEKEAHTRFSTDCDNSDAIVNIPDPNFKQALVSNPAININGDGEVQVGEARAFSAVLNLFEKNISDMTGIEVFENITGLEASNNNFTSLFLQNHDNLTWLSISNNEINALSIYQCNSLKEVDCSQNNLGSLLVPTSIEVVYANDNAIADINLRYSYNLMHLEVNNNQFADLDLRDNTQMKVLHVANNNLTWLSIANAGPDGLHELEATGNDLTCIEVNDPAFAEANWRDDVDPEASFNTHCEGDPEIVYIPDPNLKPALVALVDGYADQPVDGEVQYEEAGAFYGGIYVAGRNIQDMTGIGAFNNAGYVDCSNNQITRLDDHVGGYQAGLDISNNQLAVITVSLDWLTYFNASNNQLTALPDLGYLYELLVDHNQLTSIQMSSENYIETIHAEFNQIESVDFADFPSVTQVYINDNNLVALDIHTANYPITALDVGNNELTSLNLKNGENDELTAFNAIGNPDLACIEVDDPVQAEAEWRDNVDPQASFSEDCGIAPMSISVSPNPTMGRLHVESTAPVDEVQVFDGISGDAVTNISGQDVDISHLQKGIYLVRVRSGEKVMTTRVVKQ